MSVFRPDGERDWIFTAFVTFALLAGTYEGVARFRYGRAAKAFSLCAADASAECAAMELEKLRSLDAKNRRTLIAEAEMKALQKDVDTADALLTRALGMPSSRTAVTMAMGAPARLTGGDIDPDVLVKLTPAERGEALLAAGDIAALRGDKQRAESRWTEAAAAVEDDLVAPRRKRLADRQDMADTKLEGAVGSLKDDTDRLFELAQNGDDGFAYAATSLRSRVRGISPPAAAQKLSLAIDAAERGANLMKSRSTSLNRPRGEMAYRPDPPIKPTDEEMAKHPWARTSYSRDLQRYEQQKVRWENQQTQQFQRQAFQEDEMTKSARNVLREARQQRDEALTMLTP